MKRFGKFWENLLAVICLCIMLAVIVGGSIWLLKIMPDELWIILGKISGVILAIALFGIVGLALSVLFSAAARLLGSLAVDTLTKMMQRDKKSDR